MDKTPYSAIINKVRREKGLTVEDMERITLTRNIALIEAGTEKLNDMQINLFANVLGLSAEALKQGIRKDRKDVAGYLDVFKRQLQDAQTSEAYFLSAIQKMSKPVTPAAQSVYQQTVVLSLCFRSETKCYINKLKFKAC